MNLQEEWANMNEKVMVRLDNELAPDHHYIKKESGNLVDTLKKGLKIKLLWCRGFGLAALIGCIFSDGPVKYWLLGIFVVYELGRYLTVQKMKTLDYHVNYAEVTKEVIAAQLDLIRKTLRIEEVWGYIVLPFAAPLGLILQHLMHGKTFGMLIADPKMRYILIGLLLVGIPAIWLGGKMNNYAFGKHLRKLDEYLQQMEG